MSYCVLSTVTYLRDLHKVKDMSLPFKMIFLERQDIYVKQTPTLDRMCLKFRCSQKVRW